MGMMAVIIPGFVVGMATVGIGTTAVGQGHRSSQNHGQENYFFHWRFLIVSTVLIFLNILASCVCWGIEFR